jgi:protein-S-isoprenylcysteine O-methyltransferase Ste14
MSVERVAVVAATYATWVTFTVCMRYYFRRYRKANAAKAWLIRCGAACTLTQMAVVTVGAPPAALLAWTGVALYAAANALFWWALGTHGRDRPSFAFVPVAPASFTRRGPYRLMRHPIYTAYLVGWLAGAAAAGQPWLLAAVAVMGAFYHRAARQEERQFLTSPVREEYRSYCRRTGMFLPRLLPARRAA